MGHGEGNGEGEGERRVESGVQRKESEMSGGRKDGGGEREEGRGEERGAGSEREREGASSRCSLISLAGGNDPNGGPGTPTKREKKPRKEGEEAGCRCEEFFYMVCVGGCDKTPQGTYIS
eukprot:scaffold168907_cov31-Tisochrysis_lutea.AAC.1